MYHILFHSDSVTHVVSELDTREEVIKALKCDPDIWCEDTELVNSKWLSHAFGPGLLPETGPYRISAKQVTNNYM